MSIQSMTRLIAESENQARTYFWQLMGPFIFWDGKIDYFKACFTQYGIKI
jgi:hypothetical protein